MAIPVAVVLGMLVVAFAVQPGSAEKDSGKAAPALHANAVAALPSPSPTLAPNSPTPAVTASSNATPAPGQNGARATNAQGGSPASADVAGARATPSGTPAAGPDLSRQSTECGAIQEQAVDLAVEQSLNGVSIRATRAASYPIEYFRCILMATGGQEAIGLATSISKAMAGGATHAVLIDLWITNSGREFGQVNLKGATINAAGQTFAPLATLGGRAEVVVSSGQGRTVTLVATLKNSVGAGTGPITMSIDGPLVGGKKIAGKYQLFLPTP